MPPAVRVSRASDAPPDPATLKLRGRHKPMEGGGPIIEPPNPKRLVDDAQGRVGSPYRVVDILSMLLRNKEIQPWDAEAGEHFRIMFARAHLDPLKAADLSRGGDGALRDLPERVMMARDEVYAALKALGGNGTPVGAAAWDVLGEGRTLKEFSERMGFAPGRPLNPSVAKGLLIGALSVLAAHYGYDPELRAPKLRRFGGRTPISKATLAVATPAGLDIIRHLIDAD